MQGSRVLLDQATILPKTLVGQAVAAVAFPGVKGNVSVQPKIFRSGTATASGDTTIYTPTAGKGLKIHGWCIYVTSDCKRTAAGRINVVLRAPGGAQSIITTESFYVPSAAATVFGKSFNTGWVMIDKMAGLFPAGRNSFSADTALAINLSAALTGGVVGYVVALSES